MLVKVAVSVPSSRVETDGGLRMKTITALAPLALTFGLAGCGLGGGKLPTELQGVWASDCARPFVRFEANRLHVYPDAATYEVKTAQWDGKALTVSYDTKSGEIVETYRKAGDALRLTDGTYGGKAGKPGLKVTWNKHPMTKCPAA